ncbi:MAG: putative porin [Bacteroidales bacterium]
MHIYKKLNIRKSIHIIAAILFVACIFLLGTPHSTAQIQKIETADTVKKANTVKGIADTLNTIAQKQVKQDSIILKKPDSLMLRKLVELTIQDETEMIEELYDSLMIASGNTLVPLDSLHLMQLAFPPKVYTPKELKKMHRDSLFAYKDSVIRSKPRVLETYFFPDSLIYRRMLLWNAGTYFNNPTEIKPDTTFNKNYTELPYQKNDVGATTLGVSGSAMQYYDYFKREEFDIFPFFSPYLPYSYTPETIPFYNVKSPYTELAYWGTLFANKQKEETNIKFMHTQNFTPSLNFNILYQRFGASGILNREKTDNRTFAITGNYLGKRYTAQGGYIFNRIKRQENGGITDPSMVLDTIVDIRTIPIALADANTVVKRNTFFITHSYGIPFNFLQKRDSLGRRDSLALGEGTMAYIGHTGEFSTYTKSYKDVIGLEDNLGRGLYHNAFYINPTTSADSARVMKLENRFFIRIQPWAKNAIISRIDGGIGYQFLNYYNFHPSYFLEGNKNTTQNNFYVYFGASGQLKRYFQWEGMGTYNFIGYNQNDFSIDGKVKFSAYPNKEGIHLTGKIHISQERPNFFFNNYYSNHYIWDNNFDKTTTTKIEAKFEIPKYKFEAFFGYALLTNNVYFDTLGIPKQNGEAMSILTAYLKKDFKVWKFHMDNQILFQLSSKQDVVPLPKLSLNLRYYFQFGLVKDVLQMQLGANATFNTKYYAPAYSPALGLFHNQEREEIGNNPYIDVFVNLQWKRASIFVKYVNAAQNWPSSDYFSAFRYLRPQTALKFGIHWPFYIK